MFLIAPARSPVGMTQTSSPIYFSTSQRHVCQLLIYKATDSMSRIFTEKTGEYIAIPSRAIFSMICEARCEWNNYCRVLFGHLKISAVIKLIACDINKLGSNGKCFIINTWAQPPGLIRYYPGRNVRNCFYDWSPDSETVVRKPRPRTRPR